ncbi:hypothetical protein EOPP23_02790 [Endozoicomonas sp. OPT23]|uniref:TolC family outer membrane protein n=1 Tax=Endozoicomonas sp. OPT23 TaxID=2072845 RepID=UPI00129C0BC8|nr:TolC family outer membrane protein [Endozoicomonas sp. OPT23]MRI31924.1 hypothetical protein [Endozoicomonas sp. OPT23]
MPRFYRNGFLLAALTSTIMSAQAATTEYNLLDVYNLALKNDAQLAAAQADKMASLEGSVQARSQLLPTVAVTGQTQYNKIESVSPFNGKSKDDYNSTSWSASLTQPLFNLSSWFSYDAAKFNSTKAELDFAVKQQDLILRVADAYFKVLKSEDSLITAKAQEKAVKQQLDQARERYKVGLIPETDVLEAKASYDSARVGRIDAENGVAVSYEALRTITNKQISDIGKLNKKMPVMNPTPSSSEEWVSSALKNSIQLAAVREGLNAANSNIKAKKSGHAPTVDAFVNYQDSTRSQGRGTENDATVAGVKFTLPLFTGGATSSQVRQATYQYESAQQNYDNALRTVYAGTRNLHRTINSDVAKVDARCQGIVSSESAMKATQSGYEVGTRNITDVLNAQNALFSAQSNYLNARYDYIVNTLKLKQTVGTLSPQDLTDLNGWIVSSEEISIPAKCRAK